MPKKTTSARGGASRNKPKTQKSIQLVHPNTPVDEIEKQQDESGTEEETTLAAPTTKAAVTGTATVSKSEVASPKKSEVESVASQRAVDSSASGGNAVSRLAARRQQAAVKPQAPRNASLITAEHYAYVRRDLIYILILAIIMFSAIIILHFVPAIGG